MTHWAPSRARPDEADVAPVSCSSSTSNDRHSCLVRPAENFDIRLHPVPAPALGRRVLAHSPIVFAIVQLFRTNEDPSRVGLAAKSQVIWLRLMLFDGGFFFFSLSLDQLLV